MSGLRCTPEFVADAMARFYAMSPEAQAEMWRKQRESWQRAFGPCEHGDYDWETCPECLGASAAWSATSAHHDSNGAEEAYEHHRHELTDPGHDPDAGPVFPRGGVVVGVSGGIALAILLIGLAK